MVIGKSTHRWVSVLAVGSAVLGTVLGTGATAGANEPALSPVVLDSLGRGAYATDFNNHDQVVGYSFFPGQDYRYHAVLWDDGVLRDLGTLAGPDGSSSALGVNDRGQVVGFSDGPQGGQVPFLYENGVMTAFGPSWEGAPNDINNNGQIIGSSGGSGGSVGVKWENGVRTELAGVPGCDYTMALVNNDSGQILGACYAADGRHTVLWSPDTQAVHDLGTAVEGNDINDAGWIVGKDPATRRAVQWVPTPDGGGSVRDLGTPSDDESSTANGVNNRGQVVGASTISYPDTRAFLSPEALSGLTAPAELPYTVGSLVNDLGHVVGLARTTNWEEYQFPRVVLWR